MLREINLESSVDPSTCAPDALCTTCELRYLALHGVEPGASLDDVDPASEDRHIRDWERGLAQRGFIPQLPQDVGCEKTCAGNIRSIALPRIVPVQARFNAGVRILQGDNRFGPSRAGLSRICTC